MREYILIEKIYLKSSTTRPLRLIHFAYLVLIFCNRKLLSPLQAIYFYTPYIPDTYSVIESCLSPLPGIYFYTPYLPGTYFAVEKFCACPLQLPGFGLIAPGYWACRHYQKKKKTLRLLFFTLLLKYSFNAKYKKVLQKQSRIIVFSEIPFSKNS